ncbi:MAG: right-handed parallel beta-helix repeat-containing protein [Anaerolineae bacterium]|nr:right-handed parallel beta-helix repeat-containing protein [Anaerolineae bacterium]
MRTRRLIGVLALGLGATVALLWLLAGQSHTVQAVSSVRYVSATGSDGGLNPCIVAATPCRTVQRAVDVAAAGDEIRVAEGVFTDTAGSVAVITKTVTLLGGWDNGFAVCDPVAHLTVLDAGGNGRVVEIYGPVSPTVEGFTITGGNANSETRGDGRGGGIYSENAGPTIRHNILISNVGSITPNLGCGGGIFMSYAPASAIVEDNQVLSNTAGAGGQGVGGGLCLMYSDATISDNLIRGNTATRTGGGVYVFHGAPRLLGNEIRANAADNNGGGVMLSGSDALVQGNLIIDNHAGSSWYGGGLLVELGSPTITANRIFSNTASNSAGLGLETGGCFTVTNNVIAYNSNGGIRLWELTRYGLIAHNTIAYNGGEGGICMYYGSITPTIVNNIVVSNTYGIYAHTSASGTLDYNDVWGNATNYYLPGALEPGSHDIQADPLFVNPAQNDYHLREGSPCVDAGMNAVAAVDMDGDLRPIGLLPDLGADERRLYVYLPLVSRDY